MNDSNRLSFSDLLGAYSKARFIEQYFHRLPFSLPQVAQAFCDIGQLQALAQILNGNEADLMVVRDGRRSAQPDPASLQDVEKLLQDGHTILVRHAEKHIDSLANLADSFQREFRAPVDIHMYLSPAGSHGFSWHYDPEDVFIIQTAGRKEYSLRKNTVNPWPLVETLPADMRYERELMPLMQVELHAGDWLYIPNGYWHRAEATGAGETAISLAVGVMSRTAMDIFDYLRTRLRESILWRQRLPVMGDAATLNPQELKWQYREVIHQLEEDLQAQLQNDNFFEGYRRWTQDVGTG